MLLLSSSVHPILSQKYNRCPVIWHGTQPLEVAHQAANTFYLFRFIFVHQSHLLYWNTYVKILTGWSSQHKQLLLYWCIVRLLHWSKTSIGLVIPAQTIIVVLMDCNTATLIKNINWSSNNLPISSCFVYGSELSRLKCTV